MEHKFTIMNLTQFQANFKISTTLCRYAMDYSYAQTTYLMG